MRIQMTEAALARMEAGIVLTGITVRVAELCQQKFKNGRALHMHKLKVHQSDRFRDMDRPILSSESENTDSDSSLCQQTPQMQRRRTRSSSTIYSSSPAMSESENPFKIPLPRVKKQRTRRDLRALHSGNSSVDSHSEAHGFDSDMDAHIGSTQSTPRNSDSRAINASEQLNVLSVDNTEQLTYSQRDEDSDDRSSISSIGSGYSLNRNHRRCCELCQQKFKNGRALHMHKLKVHQSDRFLDMNRPISSSESETTDSDSSLCQQTPQMQRRRTRSPSNVHSSSPAMSESGNPFKIPLPRVKKQRTRTDVRTLHSGNSSVDSHYKDHGFDSDMDAPIGNTQSTPSKKKGMRRRIGRRSKLPRQPPTPA